MKGLLILFISRRTSSFGSARYSGDLYIQSPNQYLKGYSPRERYIFWRSYKKWVSETGIEIKADTYYALLVENSRLGPHKLRLVTYRYFGHGHHSSVELIKNDKRKCGYCWYYGHMHFKKLGIKPDPLKKFKTDGYLYKAKVSPVWTVKADVIRAPGTPHWPY